MMNMMCIDYIRRQIETETEPILVFKSKSAWFFIKNLNKAQFFQSLKRTLIFNHPNGPKFSFLTFLWCKHQFKS